MTNTTRLERILALCAGKFGRSDSEEIWDTDSNALGEVLVSAFRLIVITLREPSLLAALSNEGRRQLDRLNDSVMRFTEQVDQPAFDLKGGFCSPEMREGQKLLEEGSELIDMLNWEFVKRKYKMTLEASTTLIVVPAGAPAFKIRFFIESFDDKMLWLEQGMYLTKDTLVSGVDDLVAEAFANSARRISKMLNNFIKTGSYKPE